MLVCTITQRRSSSRLHSSTLCDLCCWNTLRLNLRYVWIATAWLTSFFQVWFHVFFFQWQWFSIILLSVKKSSQYIRAPKFSNYVIITPEHFVVFQKIMKRAWKFTLCIFTWNLCAVTGLSQVHWWSKASSNDLEPTTCWNNELYFIPCKYFSFIT